MDISKFIGSTDEGQPIVTTEQSCNCFQTRDYSLIESRTCWYCSYVDFRKTTAMHLAQSICCCPQNQVPIELRNKKGD